MRFVLKVLPHADSALAGWSADRNLPGSRSKRRVISGLPITVKRGAASRSADHLDQVVDRKRHTFRVAPRRKWLNRVLEPDNRLELIQRQANSRKRRSLDHGIHNHLEGTIKRGFSGEKGPVERSERSPSPQRAFGGGRINGLRACSVCGGFA